jgi:WD40 repeat protein
MDVAWSPDGSKLVSASRDKTSKIFDMKTGDSLVTFNSHGAPVFGAGFTPDGTQAVTSGGDKQIRVWNVADAKELRAIGGFSDEVFRIKVTADGHVYSFSADKMARVHNIADGKEIKSFAGHNDWVYAVDYNPATKKLATGSYDGEVRIWSVEAGNQLAAFLAAPGYNAQQTASAAK